MSIEFNKEKFSEEYYLKNKELLAQQRRESSRRNYRKNKESVISSNKKWAKNNPSIIKEAMRKYLLKSKYNITPEEYDSLCKKQSGRCLICDKKPLGNKKLHIDHCHTTGKVRGLLCNKCNLGLGLLNDDIVALNKAILYLSTGSIDL